MCGICDTLRTDDDTGDECVECGAVYTDLYQRRKEYIPLAEPTSSQVSLPVAPKVRSVAPPYYSVNFGGGGLTVGRLRR